MSICLLYIVDCKFCPLNSLPRPSFIVHLFVKCRGCSFANVWRINLSSSIGKLELKLKYVLSSLKLKINIKNLTSKRHLNLFGVRLSIFITYLAILQLSYNHYCTTYLKKFHLRYILNITYHLLMHLN